MDTTALEIKDIFGLADEKAERAANLLERLVKRASHEETYERIEAKVEKEVAREVKVLEARSEAYATKGDIYALREDMHAMGKDLLKWMVTGIIAILLSIIALTAVFYFSLRDIGPPHRYPTEVPERP